MKLKPLMLLAVAVACGLIAMVGVQQALNNGKRGGADPDLVKVYAAIEDIPAGTPIAQEMLIARQVHKSAVPEGAVTDMKQIEDRALMVKAFKGDLIFDAKLCKKGQIGASVAIPEGMRAFTIPVTETQAHSGMVQPGDRVDVACAYEIRSANGPAIPKNRTILEYIQVFAVDNHRDLDKEKIDQKHSVKSLTLLVTPDQAVILGLLQSKGAPNFSFSLRNPNDKPKMTAKKRSVDFTEIDSGAYEVLKDLGVEPGGEKKPEKKPQPSTLSELDSFLKSNLSLLSAATTVTTKAPSAVPEPEVRKIWKMSISDNKGERITEEIDLTPQKNEVLHWEDPGLKDKGTAPNGPSADQDQGDPLKQSASLDSLSKSVWSFVR